MIGWLLLAGLVLVAFSLVPRCAGRLAEKIFNRLRGPP